MIRPPNNRYNPIFLTGYFLPGMQVDLMVDIDLGGNESG